MRGSFAALALLTACFGCAGGFSKVVKAPPEPLECTTVFVYPFRFSSGGEQEARVFALTQRLLDGALRSHGEVFAFYGPSEFQLLKPEVPQLWAASTALPVLMKAGSRPAQGLALRASAEKRVMSNTRLTDDAEGKEKTGEALEETTWLGKVEIFHLSSGLTLVEVSGQVTTNPFDEAPEEADFDPAPALTKMMARLTRAALDEVKRHAVRREELGPELDATLALTPRTILAVGKDSVGAGAELARFDALDAEVMLQNQARFLAPWVSDGEAAKLAAAPPGLMVMAAPDDAKVKPGEVILTLDGQLALPQVLARERLKQLPLTAQVRRPDGSTYSVLLP